MATKNGAAAPGSDDGSVPVRLVRSVGHAIGLMRILAESNNGLTLSELTRRGGLSKTSTFHLVRTLEVERFVARNETGKYRLSWGAYEIGSVVARSVDLTRAARVHLDRLAERTGEAALLAIAEGQSVLYLDRGQSDQSFTMVANVGRRSPLHTNASGKALLAHMPDRVVESVIAAGLERRTSATIVDPQILREELGTIRSRGYAACWQEQEPALNSIAVPLWDYTGQVCATLTVAGPSTRLTRRAVPRLLGILQDEAASVSAELGGASGAGPRPGSGAGSDSGADSGTVGGQ